MTRAGRSAFVVAFFVFVAIVSGCSSNKKASGPEQFDPAQGATAIRALGFVKVAGEATYQDQTKQIDGTISYEPRLSLVKFPVGVGKSLVEVEYRRLGDKAWLQAAESAELPRLGVPIVVVRPKGYPRRWQTADPEADGLAMKIVRPYDPAALLTALSDLKIEFSRDGEETVDGKSRARFVASIPKEKTIPAGVASAKVFTDEDGLPVRFDVVPLGAAEGSYTVSQADGDRPQVEPPPSDEIERTEALPVAKGPYVEVASGDAGGTPYRVLRAPATRDGWFCWKVESDPAFVHFEDPQKDGSVCLYSIDPQGDTTDQIAIPLDASAKNPYELLGLLMTPGSKMTAHLVDGTTKEVPVDANGLGIYAGPASPAVGLAEVVLPDGNTAYCAPGTVNNLRDLEELDIASGDELRGQPWNCLEKSAANSLGG